MNVFELSLRGQLISPSQHFKNNFIHSAPIGFMVDSLKSIREFLSYESVQRLHKLLGIQLNELVSLEVLG